jgi:hypothetical protein
MAEIHHLNKVPSSSRTANISPEIAPGRSECTLIKDGYTGSKWEFTRRDDPTGIYYTPLRPVRDEQTVPSMMVDPLTIASDFFSPADRIEISDQKAFSRDPRDWYLTGMKIIPGDGDGIPNPGTEGPPSEYPVRLIFEVPNSNVSSFQFAREALSAVGRSIISSLPSEQANQGPGS